MKSAIQELIDKLTEKKEMWKSDGKESDRHMRGAYTDAIVIAKELQEKEKNQIIHAHNKGIDIMNGDYHIGEVSEGELFYNQNYLNKIWKK